jgi:hypothetical protein
MSPRQEKKENQSWGGCFAQFVVGGACGLPICAVLIWILEGALHPLGRSCPQGWGMLVVGSVLVLSSIFYAGFRNRLNGSFWAGMGVAMMAVGGFTVFLYSAFPSC